MCATNMAIPFNLPSDDETEDNYRRLDQLLVDLYHVLRQILTSPRYTPGPLREERGGGAPAPGPVAGDVIRSRRPDLPDLVSSAISCHCQCPSRRRSQRRHRRWRPRSCSGCHVRHVPEQTRPLESPSPSSPSRRVELPARAPQRIESWLIVGEQLRKIAEEFKMTLTTHEISKEKEENLKMEVKTSGLFSLLIPTHFRSSLWTTVILLVGWRLLVRSR